MAADMKTCYKCKVEKEITEFHRGKNTKGVLMSTQVAVPREQVIAQNCLTNSKNPLVFPENFPRYIERGEGCLLYDKHGNKYIDYIAALGTNLLGYSNPYLNEKIKEQIDKGVLFSLSSERELDLGCAIVSICPWVEKIKILKTGNEGCLAAVRIARVHRKNHLVFSSGYHGHGNEWTSLTPPANGVPLDLHMKKLDSSVMNQICIIEPVITDIGNERIDEVTFLTKNNYVIMDETITFARFPNYTFSKQSHFEPDLIVFGKALAGGLPISVVGGKREAMDSDYFVSSTFSGDLIAIVAAIQVLNLLRNKYSLEFLFERANNFQKMFNDIEPDIISLSGYGTRSIFVSPTDYLMALFFQECLTAGILFGRSFFYGFANVEYDDHTLSICREVIRRIRKKEVTLNGRLPSTPQTMKSRR